MGMGKHATLGMQGPEVTDGVRLGRDLHSLSHLQPSRLNSINVTW